MALAAIALLAGLTAAFAAADVSNLASQQRGELARAIAVAAGAAWDENNTWSSADLSPVLDLAARTGTAVQIRDQSGHVVASSGGFSAADGAQSSLPVVVRGERVGTALVRSTGSGLDAADRSLKTALLRAIAGAAGLAALLALLTGLAVARRITRPVTRLIAATRSMAAGDRTARVGEIHAAGELRELAAAFDQMAGTLDRQEQIRRNLVADVAHELRTPIAILQAGHEALLDGVAEPTPAELGSLRDEVLRLARMVGDLQTLAAADAAALNLTRTPADLAELAATAADSLARRFEAAGITLDRELSASPVLADPHWLHQVDHQPAHQRAEVHPGRRPRHHQHQEQRPRGGAPGRRHRRRHPRRRPAPHLRPVLPRPAGRPDLRQRYRPDGGRRTGPGPRRPADRRQRARSWHSDDPQLAFGLASPFLHTVPIATSSRLRSARLGWSHHASRRR